MQLSISPKIGASVVPPSVKSTEHALRSKWEAWSEWCTQKKHLQGFFLPKKNVWKLYVQISRIIKNIIEM